MSWSQLSWNYNDTPVSFYATFSNDTDETVTIESIIISAGTVLGSVGDTDGTATHIGPRIEGDGSPILLNINGITQSISNKISVIEEEFGNVPNLDECVDYTVLLNIEVEPQQSKSISIVASGGSCLAIKEIKGDSSSSGGDVLLEWTIMYDANGGVFESGDTQLVEYFNDSESISILSDDLPQGAIYSVKFNPNGGTSSGAVVNLNQTQLSWNTEPDGSGTKYEFNQEFVITEDIVLYAQWTNPTLQKSDIPDTSRDRYLLECWNTRADGSGQDISEGTIISSDLEIFAIWITTPLMIMTEDGWKPLPPQSTTTADYIRTAHRKKARDIEWKHSKPVYRWSGTNWEKLSKGSRYENTVIEEES